jgi:hypothetical protein
MLLPYEGGHTTATLLPHGRRLYVRTISHLYCLGGG